MPGAPPDPTPASPTDDRVVGIDVARAFAILGMVWINFKYQMEVMDGAPEALAWAMDRLDGRAAALFVVLAGVGVSLRARRVRTDPTAFRPEARALAVRAVVLLVLGLLFVHLWDWDILHCYGLYLLLAIPFLRLPTPVLWGSALLLAPSGLLVRPCYEGPWDDSLFTPWGLASDLWVSGLHPALPWFAFLLLGMAVGRLDLTAPGVRRRLLAGAALVVLVGEGIDLMAVEQAWPEAWSSKPRPPGPVFVAAGGATAVTMFVLCIEATQPRPRAAWVLGLTATGQLAFTWYIGHAVAILVPLQHGAFARVTLWSALGYGTAFFLAAVAASLWWRRRYPVGPLEGLIRQLTGRTTPAPWGGRTLV